MSSSSTWMRPANMEWVPNWADRTGAKRLFIWAVFQVWHPSAFREHAVLKLRNPHQNLALKCEIIRLEAQAFCPLLCRYYSCARTPVERPLFPWMCEESRTEPQACHAVKTLVGVWICGDSGLPCLIDLNRINPKYSTYTDTIKSTGGGFA